MTLSPLDDYPVHQIPEVMRHVGTSDRNFYDRYFFNGYSPDGSEFVAAAFGVYPALNVADAHVSVIRDGVQRCFHASSSIRPTTSPSRWTTSRPPPAPSSMLPSASTIRPMPTSGRTPTCPRASMRRSRCCCAG